MKLSEHFTLAELTATQTGLDNTPPDYAKSNLYTLAEALELVRTACHDKPIRILSGYRSKEVNEKVKGSKTSAHIHGLAADFIVGDMDLGDIFSTIRKSGIVYDQLILEPSWIHIGLAEIPRQQNLTFDGVKYAPV